MILRGVERGRRKEALREKNRLKEEEDKRKAEEARLDTAIKVEANKRAREKHKLAKEKHNTDQLDKELDLRKSLLEDAKEEDKLLAETDAKNFSKVQLNFEKGDRNISVISVDTAQIDSRKYTNQVIENPTSYGDYRKSSTVTHNRLSLIHISEPTRPY